MRTAVTLAVGLAVALVCVAIAAADADVELRNTQLRVTVRALTNADGIHGMIIEGFNEQAGRDGWRVRQDSLGRPAFVENDADCSRNVVFNDVICTGTRGSALVTGGDSTDAVVFSEFPGGREHSTFAVEFRFASGVRYIVKLADPAIPCLGEGRPRAEIAAAVNLGAGNDILAVLEMAPCSDPDEPSRGLQAIGSFLARLDARGGPGADNMRGGPAADTMAGDGEDDTVEGVEGNDTLSGGAGADTLVGGLGRDTLSAGPDGDALFARDGGFVFDIISCGTGVDSAEGDLADFFAPTRPATTPPTFTSARLLNNASDCENITTMPFDDGPPGRAVGRTLKRTSNGTGTIRVACPRTARVSCRGTLTVRLGRAYGPVIARARYTAALGKQTAVRVALGSARRGAKVFVHTVEQGVSTKGPALLGAPAPDPLNFCGRPAVPTYRLHDHEGDDLGLVEHPAPNVEPGDVVVFADDREALVTARVEAEPLAALLEVVIAPPD